MVTKEQEGCQELGEEAENLETKFVHLQIQIYSICYHLTVHGVVPRRGPLGLHS